MHRTLKVLLALAALVIPLAACGGDDDGGSGGGSVQAYCDFSASLDDQDDFPTEQQFEQLSDLAPDEIDDDVDFVIDRFNEAGGDEEAIGQLFEDEEIGERIERIEAFEQRECGRDLEE